MEKIKIDTLEQYFVYLLHKKVDALADDRFELSHPLRVQIQKEQFGGNDASGNEKFYRYCLKMLPMCCENCGKPITHPSAYNVSHILSRGSHPEMAHDIRNINILCPTCHNLWEHSTTRSQLRLFFVEKNQRRIEMLKSEYNESDKK